MPIINLNKRLIKLESNIKRLRYLALFEKYIDCFKLNNNILEFQKKFKKTPEEYFLEQYSYWMKLNKVEVLSKVKDIFGDDIMNSFWIHDVRETKHIKKIVDGVILKIESGKLVQPIY